MPGIVRSLANVTSKIGYGARFTSDQPPVCEEAANAMATGNSAPAAPSAHPDTKWQATRDISTLVARDDASLSPRFVVVSEGSCLTPWSLTVPTHRRINLLARPVLSGGIDSL